MMVESLTFVAVVVAGNALYLAFLKQLITPQKAGCVNVMLGEYDTSVHPAGSPSSSSSHLSEPMT